ncbi:uncharacterized protein LOC119363742 isoform X2 [Triticum dicoccoides]|uniref:uncharacterized protein LOC119363742 isoform X2 n=1 Tax=Triticum dicoccoides TaxID=85692 RepID=UPI00188FCC07|nr:uncharacterized protein LOC119363742 isoform X2 [Triticum dicoccoides]
MACYISATRLPKYSLCSKLDSDKGVHPAIWSEVREFILGCLISRTPLMTTSKLGEPEGTSRTRTISLKVKTSHQPFQAPDDAGWHVAVLDPVVSRRRCLSSLMRDPRCSTQSRLLASWSLIRFPAGSPHNLQSRSLTYSGSRSQKQNLELFYLAQNVLAQQFAALDIFLCLFFCEFYNL